MRRSLLVVLCFVLMTACASAPTPIEEPPGNDEQPAPTAAAEPSSTGEPSATQLPADLTPAQLGAVQALSESLGVPVEEIKLGSTEAVDWPDGCLGVQEEGVMCTEAIVRGFRILLEAQGREVEYRTNEDGAQVRPATVLMKWRREGGIAGFCDFLTLYLSGEVHRSSCDGNQLVEERLREVLSREELARLEEWVQEYSAISIDASDPKGVSDRMVITLEFIGLGSRETVTSAEEQQLLQFAQSLNETLAKGPTR